VQIKARSVIWNGRPESNRRIGVGSPALSRLSYARPGMEKDLASQAGLKPATSCFEDRRSILLSYWPLAIAERRIWDCGLENSHVALTECSSISNPKSAAPQLIGGPPETCTQPSCLQGKCAAINTYSPFLLKRLWSG
jgi:hypothetical protein